MKKISNSSSLALALMAVFAGYGSTQAQTIYVDDSWGAAPTRSHATIPYEDTTEDRIYYNPTTNAYSSTTFADDGNVANGPETVPTGLTATEYYPLAGPYAGLTNGSAVPAFDDPTTPAVESLTPTYGTDAFSTVKAAFARIGAAPAGTYTKLVILSGTYFETVYVPSNVLNNPTANAYYTPLTNAAFFGKFQANFTIAGDPVNKPVFTRGLVLDGENTTGMTIADLYLTGVPGTNGNGVQVASQNRILSVVGGSSVFPYPGTTTAGVRNNLTLSGLVLDGKKNRLPFGQKMPANGASPGYTASANNNIVGGTGGRGGIQIKGEYGTLAINDSTFTGIRSFCNFDMNAATNSSATWTTFSAERNTLEDCWGNFAVRGEDPNYTAGAPTGGARQPQVGIADDVIMLSNTVRDMGEDMLKFTTNGANAFLYDNFAQSGAAFKVFNVRNLRFENNTVTRVNIMRDWFAKASQTYPGDPLFIPMGGGLIVRDFRWAGTLTGAPPYGPWSDLTTINVKGNLFEYCQQGIGFDTGSGLSQQFVPDGIISGNRFYNNRMAIFFYDSKITSQSVDIVDNIIEDTNSDPFGTGIAGDPTTVGGIVFDNPSTTAQESTTVPPLDLSDNYWGGGAPDIVYPPSTGPSGGTVNITPATIEGEAPGEYDTTYTNPDPDADGIASILEDANGNSIVDPGETDPNDADTDNDGLNDGLELRLGYDPTSASSPSSTTDTDHDHLPDAVEAGLGLNPNDADTDNDGIRDDYELQVGTNPLAADSIPNDFGDADGDGQVDNVDATAILLAFLDLATLSVTNIDKVDINRDGKVDNVDAIIVFNYQVGNIPYIPFP